MKAHGRRVWRSGIFILLISISATAARGTKSNYPLKKVMSCFHGLNDHNKDKELDYANNNEGRQAREHNLVVLPKATADGSSQSFDYGQYFFTSQNVCFVPEKLETSREDTYYEVDLGKNKKGIHQKIKVQSGDLTDYPDGMKNDPPKERNFSFGFDHNAPSPAVVKIPIYKKAYASKLTRYGRSNDELATLEKDEIWCSTHEHLDNYAKKTLEVEVLRRVKGLNEEYKTVIKNKKANEKKVKKCDDEIAELALIARRFNNETNGYDIYKNYLGIKGDANFDLSENKFSKRHLLTQLRGNLKLIQEKHSKLMREAANSRIKYQGSLEDFFKFLTFKDRQLRKYERLYNKHYGDKNHDKHFLCESAEKDVKRSKEGPFLDALRNCEGLGISATVQAKVLEEKAKFPSQSPRPKPVTDDQDESVDPM